MIRFNVIIRHVDSNEAVTARRLHEARLLLVSAGGDCFVTINAANWRQRTRLVGVRVPFLRHTRVYFESASDSVKPSMHWYRSLISILREAGVFSYSEYVLPSTAIRTPSKKRLPPREV